METQMKRKENFPIHFNVFFCFCFGILYSYHNIDKIRLIVMELFCLKQIQTMKEKQKQRKIEMVNHQLIGPFDSILWPVCVCVT